MRSTLQHLDVVDRAVGGVRVRAEVAMRIGRVEELLDALFDLRAPELRDERIAGVGFRVAEVEVVDLLPAPGLEARSAPEATPALASVGGPPVTRA